MVKSTESVIQMMTDQIRALHRIHAVASHYHALALKAGGKMEQLELMANGLDTVLSLAQKAVASVKSCGIDIAKEVKTGDKTQAVGKNGKPLAGIALESFMKKREADAKVELKASYEAKAIDKNGKPLAGAAKKSFMKKCEAEAGVSLS